MYTFFAVQLVIFKAFSKFFPLLILLRLVSLFRFKKINTDNKKK